MSEANENDLKLPVFSAPPGTEAGGLERAVWAIGNGLASTTLVIYLCQELHADGLAWESA